ncbi:MAG TPA: PaaI family thioesterase [Polyangiaceae bacterium]|nr:PaaI family thioesterase [Polyangiaceae bacterium]
MSDLMRRIETFRETGDTTGMTDAIPYSRFLGVSLLRDEEGLLGKLTYSDHLVGNPELPALHGGTIGALLEMTAIFQLLWEAETLVLPKTINITVQYLRSARPIDTYARSIITKRGRRVVTARVEAWQDDPARPVAMANAHFLVIGKDP